MEALFCWLVGILFTIGVYLLMSSNILRVLFGALILGNAVNLLIFTIGELGHNSPAFIRAGQSFTETSNALPQALILTAIVIGFGLMTYCLILVRSAWHAMDTLDSDEMHAAEPSAIKDGEL